VIGLASALALASPPACTALGAALVEHACIHANHGPFGDGLQPHPLAAGSRRTLQDPAPPAVPNVNRVHTHFRIALPPGEAEGVVSYLPARGGQWAVFTNPGVPVAILDPAGRPLATRLEQEAPGCAELPRAAVYELEASTTYRLVLGPSSAAEVGLVLEKLSDFTLFYYADEDGDDHGAAGSEVETACLPPDGHVESDGDCDDHAATVHPGAVELCNGRDDDCDGMTDEGCPGVGDGEAPSQSSCQLAAADRAPPGPMWGAAVVVVLLGLLRRAGARAGRARR
jgi:hypothetical protein